MKAFLKSVIEDPEYQEALRARMIAGKAAHMEQLATFYVLGKPQEQVQVQTSPNMGKLLVMALQEASANERAEVAAVPPLPPGA